MKSQQRAGNGRTDVIRIYLDALSRGDMDELKSLFTADGVVHSAFLGPTAKDEFFDRLGRSSTRNVITLIDIFESATGSCMMGAYFRYQWTVLDGSEIDFNVMDVFEFAEHEPLIQRVTMVMDTHAIREQHGNKYVD